MKRSRWQSSLISTWPFKTSVREYMLTHNTGICSDIASGTGNDIYKRLEITPSNTWSVEYTRNNTTYYEMVWSKE